VSSVLSDGTIRRLVHAGRIKIEPWDPGLVQPASIDLRLGDSFRVFHNHRASAIDLRNPPSGLTEEVVIGRDESFVIHPGEFCLGRTLEWVELPDDVVARIEGKSSIGRLGLIVHATAGFCDPGWKGTLTLELNNLTRVPIKLYAGLLIAQLSFMALDTAAELPYGSPELGSHYQGQRAATESRYEGGAAARPPIGYGAALNGPDHPDRRRRRAVEGAVLRRRRRARGLRGDPLPGRDLASHVPGQGRARRDARQLRDGRDRHRLRGRNRQVAPRSGPSVSSGSERPFRSAARAPAVIRRPSVPVSRAL
jgi:dCTP deaminase